MKYEKYKSVHIILEEQSPEFALRKSMSIRGEARLETGNGKGAVRVTVQNLMPPDRCGRSFMLCFFGRADDGTIHTKLGNLVLNRFGNGETYFRFNPCNVDGSGHELEDFIYVVVAAAPLKKTGDPLKPVLTGNLNHTREIPLHDDEPSCDEKPACEEKIAHDDSPEPQTYNCYYNRIIMQKSEKLHLVMERNRDLWQNRIEPFRDDKLGAEWYKVDNYKLLPLISDGAEDACIRYRHFIFGIKEKRYYIGVPGRLTKEDQPESGLSGFTYWQPIESIGLGQQTQSYGYWITAIDTESGDIIDAGPVTSKR